MLTLCRMANHRGESSTDSTVTSPSVTNSSLERISSPMAKTPSRAQVHSSPGKDLPPAVTATPPFKQSGQPGHKLSWGSNPISPPPTVRLLPPPGVASPSNRPRIKKSTFPPIGAGSESDYEPSSPTFESGGPSRRFVSPINQDPPAPDQSTMRNVFKPSMQTNPLDPLDALHPILTSMEPEYSAFYSPGMCLVSRVSADIVTPLFQNCETLKTRSPLTHSMLENHVTSSCVTQLGDA